MRQIGIAMVVVIVATLLTVTCTSSQTAPTFTPLPTPTAPSGFLTFTDEVIGFQISYPPSWEPIDSELVASTWERNVDTLSQEGWDLSDASLIFAAGLPTNEGGYLPSINIGVEPLPSGMSADDYIKESIAGTKKDRSAGFTFVAQSDIQIGNLAATLIQFEVPAQDHGGPSGWRYTMIQLFVPQDRVGWVVTCALLSADIFWIPSSDDLIDTCESSVRSLKILD